MAASSHFGCPKITLYRIFYHFTILILWMFLQNGCRRPFWMSENHFRSQFWPFQINTKLFLFFFTKWPPAPILDVQNSLSIAFLAISDQYATLIFFWNFYFCELFTTWRPFWMSFTFDRISDPFRSIRNFNFIFVNYLYKMSAGGHFGCPKVTFGRISGHFRSIRNF